MTSVVDAFRRARIDAGRHMRSCERAQIRWGETAVTEVVISRAAEAVSVVPFTPPAEALSGADWIWWWLDANGAFGMLVQAKRVTITHPDRWSFGFDYRRGTRLQKRALMSTASRLGLMPVYALYLGTGEYRDWKRCPDGHRSGRCLQCEKRSVSLMPALLAEKASVVDSDSTYDRSVALEDLMRPSPHSAPLIPTLQGQLPCELAEFLTTSQTGVRAVTRSMLDRVLKARAGQLAQVGFPVGSVQGQGTHDDLGPIFGHTPADTGHWGVTYFEHVLRPLLHVPPSYVLEIESGDFNRTDLPLEMSDVAGVIIVRLPNDG